MTTAHKWQFAPRFRYHSFGWKSDTPIQRIKEALSEIKQVAKKQPDLAAAGAVLFLEKISPAIEQVDSSSGAIGTAFNRSIDTLVTIIFKATVEQTVRDRWLERLFEAMQADQIPYLESLGEYLPAAPAKSSAPSAVTLPVPADLQVVDITSLEVSQSRSVGVEQVGLWAMQQLSFIEQTLFSRITDLFGFSTTITLYDLTNTYFEGELNAINAGLQRPRTEKNPNKLSERIGRLKGKHHGIGQHYHIELQTDESGEKVISLTWQKQVVAGSSAKANPAPGGISKTIV